MQLVRGSKPKSKSISECLEALKPGLDRLREDLDQKSSDIKKIEEALRQNGFAYEFLVFRKRRVTVDHCEVYGETSEGYFLGWLKDEHGKFRLQDVRARYPAGREEELHFMYDFHDFVTVTSKKPVIESKADDRILSWYDLPMFLEELSSYIEFKFLF